MADDDNVIPLAVAPEPSWLKRLHRTKEGMPLPTLANALIILANDPKFDGMMMHNAFTSQHLLMRPVPLAQEDDAPLRGPYPRGWGAEDVSLVQAYMQRVWAERFRRSDIEAAMQAHAGARTFHPVEEWLSGLVWDGTGRLDHWLVKVFDPADYETETAYYQAVGARFLLAAVRRVRSPGCKFDHMPIFEGPQGIGKSTALRRLFGDDYFSDAIPPDLSSRDTALSLLGMWCMEFAEIEHLIRNDPEIVKAFFSRQTDRYRPPYGHDFVFRPRQLVMAGTTNKDDYLRDDTGNRRFWPIRCQAVRLDWLDANRDQLWAEAASREASGETIWLDDVALIARSTAAAHQRMTSEVWEPAIVKWLADPETFLSEETPMTSARVLEFGLGMSKEKMSKAAEMRVTRVLRALGWLRKFRRFRAHGREISDPIWMWLPPEFDAPKADLEKERGNYAETGNIPF